MIPSSDPSSSGLTDRHALLAHRARACAGRPVDFLHAIALAEIQDRLAEINRTFKDVAVITGMTDFWQAAFPDARILPDDEQLDLAPASLDLVIHAMALHWANDPVGQMIQAARALRPDGLFLAVLPGGRNLHELRDCLTRAEVEVVSGLSPRFLPLGEIRDLGALLSRAGLALPVADQQAQKASYRNLFHLAADLRGMGETNALSTRIRHLTRRDIMLRAAQIYHSDYPDPDDCTRIIATYELIYLTGWAPADNQQKPLRPGSAKMPLAEALASKRNAT